MSLQAVSSPESAMVTLALGWPEFVPLASMAFTTSSPSSTLPNTTWRPSSQGVFTVVMKNWDLKRRRMGWIVRKNANEATTPVAGGCFKLMCRRSYAPVGIWTSIRHTKIHRTFVLEIKVLIFKLWSVNRFSATVVANVKLEATKIMLSRLRSRRYTNTTHRPLKWVKSPPWIIKLGTDVIRKEKKSAQTKQSQPRWASETRNAIKSLNFQLRTD